MADYPFNGRKLRPLIPRPVTSPNNNNTSTTTPSLNRIHGGANDFFSQYHNLQVGDQSKRSSELNNNSPATGGGGVVVSSRWNPTPEQLRALEELYRRGTRTPSAEQIQQITAQLRRFGKIEGKNVFYWFQNHKARERQKRRRQMESAADQFDATLEKKDLLGASRTVFEVEHTKNWLPSSNSSTSTLPLAEESVSIQRAAAKADQYSRTDGWVQFDEATELQQRRNFMERNATWHMMQENAFNIHLSSINNNNNSTHHQDDHCLESDQTLQLFPIRNGGGGDHGVCSDDVHHNNIINQQHKETEISASAIMNAPNQFIEFLPLKN
ncbi:hypothetical protein TSUD_72920 [Trifolium subterraneum]|uniref:Homeobox domain-containing protein n=1 Tax=Trifolium subterraneum TaxID=3900 RepID=A0A2Z6M2C3_TRISU|nr:hypothetical protein TSUD_72920 [Trifolium subterraneum]